MYDEVRRYVVGLSVARLMLEGTEFVKEVGMRIN